MANNSGPKRDELLENLRAKLRALFPSGTLHAREKSAETLECASEQALGGVRIRDVAVAAGITAPVGALLIRNAKRGGIVVVNKVHAVTRRRFSAAHELGHYYLGHYANGDSWTVRYEWAANGFAAELLMPTPAVVSFWFARELRREPFLWRVAAALDAVRRKLDILGEADILAKYDLHDDSIILQPHAALSRGETKGLFENDE